MAYGKPGKSKTKMFCSLRKFMVMFDEEHKGKGPQRRIKSVCKSQRTLLHPTHPPPSTPAQSQEKIWQRSIMSVCTCKRSRSDSVGSCRCARAKERISHVITPTPPHPTQPATRDVSKQSELQVSAFPSRKWDLCLTHSYSTALGSEQLVTV